MAKIWHFCEFFHFYSILNYHEIRTRTNFEIPNCKSLDLHLIMWFSLKQLFPGSTYFAEAIFKIPQISKHFYACHRLNYLLSLLCNVEMYMIHMIIQDLYFDFCQRFQLNNFFWWWHNRNWPITNRQPGSELNSGFFKLGDRVISCWKWSRRACWYVKNTMEGQEKTSIIMRSMTEV